MSPQEFYELLNRKVFFWVRPERLDMLLGARAYRNRPHDVLTIDTATMIERHGAGAALASINTGATLYPSAPQRGPSTFQSITDFDLAAARRRRSNRDAIVELAIDYAVLDVAEFVLRVERRWAGRATQILWHRCPPRRRAPSGTRSQTAIAPEAAASALVAREQA